MELAGGSFKPGLGLSGAFPRPETSRRIDGAQEQHQEEPPAAAFCMYNRYVDGLDTWQPHDETLYRERAKKTAREGYVDMSREYLPQAL